jgi:hypothetical protein
LESGSFFRYLVIHSSFLRQKMPIRGPRTASASLNECNGDVSTVIVGGERFADVSLAVIGGILLLTVLASALHREHRTDD